ncbi:serine/threonine-protein kinase [Stigmatella sp. ncwal1]|uniref:Serine/threonine-protein kinase n=1 Tax=Stigmatella ashevillensis TaxID=2995309 RepID=A0ABT5D306_9BACT|nr:serine/threonine-protein kinase [Stigmatella ashevillena]MDC0708053.1 serine/threonine-protein kinase [Stigmatella ashevillena]
MPSPPSGPPPATGPVLLQSGHTTYELIRPLEQTWHGELLLARRHFDKTSGDYVVLKRLSRDCREEDYRRLMEEVAVTSRLHHPGIAGLHDVQGTTGDPYLVLEHVEGHRLDALLELSVLTGKALSEAFACYLGVEVADALHHAHELTSEEGRWLRLVHRNVSPLTLMVGQRGEVKLTDFGTVWSTLPGRQPTEDDALPGNLAYASPELTRKGMLDGRTDQFSLGAVLFHVLTGKPLLEGAERLSQEMRELRRRMDEVQALGPRDRAGALLVADLKTQLRTLSEGFIQRIRGLTARDVMEATRMLPTGLRPILRRSLSPRRSDRYASCAEFGHDLRMHLFRLGPMYGRPEAEREVAALVQGTPRMRPRSALPRRVSSVGEKRRKREPSP